MYITSQADLESFVQRAQNASVLAIDTEFLREKTYYAKLCLLQLATEDEVALIDPFRIRSLDPLLPLFQDSAIVKLFHAAGQDLGILYHETGVLPEPIFDTQIAAALLGHTQQVGYASLVYSQCGVQLKKIDSFTDWSRRPLSQSQLEYAADDVRYLPQLYHSMKQELEKKGRLHWLDQDFAALSDPSQYETDERERYKRLKRVSQLSRRQLSAAREVTAWRELEAQHRDVPRKWVLTDEHIVEACKREARTVSELFMLRGLSDRLSTRDARTVVTLIAKGLDSPESTWPDNSRSGRNEPNVDAQLDLMTALVRLRAKENDVAFPTLASHDDLVHLARGYTDGVQLLSGWRRALVGEELLDLLDGRISLSLDGSDLKVTETSR